MSKINWAKIDKFYPILITVMVVLAALFVLTFRTIFSVFETAYKMKQGSSDTELRVNKSKLEEAYSFIFEKLTVSPEAKPEEKK